MNKEDNFYVKQIDEMREYTKDYSRDQFVKMLVDQRTEIAYLKQVLNEIGEDVIFCVNDMKSEYACTDKRTNRELHTMAKILKESLQKIDKVLQIIDKEDDRNENI